VSDSHAEQRQRAIRASLVNAGIGRAYHERHLSDVAPALVDPAKDLARVRSGHGYTLVGTDHAYDAAVVMARALHLQGLPVVIVPLRRLVKWIEHETVEMAWVQSCEALFITGFFDPSLGECPLAGWQRHDIEELLNDRIDNGGAFFPQVTRNLERGGWWSDTLIRRIARLNTVWSANV
jgi:hypothetical protein